MRLAGHEIQLIQKKESHPQAISADDNRRHDAESYDLSQEEKMFCGQRELDFDGATITKLPSLRKKCDISASGGRKECIWKAEKVSASNSVVTVSSLLDFQIARIVHFLSVSKSGETTQYVTLRVYNRCFKDDESGLHYTDINDFSISVLPIEFISEPCVYVADDQNNTLWVLNNVK